MLLRRLIALFSSVTMLHLSVRAADAACAGGDGPTEHSAAAHALDAGIPAHSHHVANLGARDTRTAASVSQHAHAVRIAGVAATPGSHGPGGSPAQPRCCESMTTCSVTGTVTPHVAIVSAVPCASGVMPSRTDAASPVPQAPEPPPPKA